MTQPAKSSKTRFIRCPTCGLTVSAPADKPLPDEGPTCAMGHEPVAMQTVISEGAYRG